MIKIYPLEWLDSLILETLSPKNTNIHLISELDLSFISQTIFKESHKIQIRLKTEVFSLPKKRQIRLLVRKYHSTLIFLLDTVIENQKEEVLSAPQLVTVFDNLLNCLDALLSFVEGRFSNYLSLDERVPITYLIVSRNDIKLKLEKLQQKKISTDRHPNVLEIVVSTVQKFINSSMEHQVTYRQIVYQKEVLKRLEKANSGEERLNLYSSLDEVLIAMNFNCPDYINYLIENISSDLNAQSTGTDRMGRLLLYLKEFGQLYSSEKIMYDPSERNVKEILNNWFTHEISFLEKDIALSEQKNNLPTTPFNGIIAENENKIECILSIDQMGLILRATDETRILKAKSMSQVFKTIVPHLSTPFKKDLSYQSVRSKSYNAEERDKLIAIQTLEKIIKKIKTY